MPLSRRAFKDLRDLRLKKHRRAQGRCLIEGARLVSEALRSPAEVEQVLVTARFARSDGWAAIEADGRSRELKVDTLTETWARQLADTRHPQGIFAVVRLPSEPAPPSAGFQPPILILDDITDPGNLGTLLRTADWFGVPTVWVSKESADIYNPKVLRGGMGAHFHIPSLWQGDLTAPAQQIPAEDITLFGAALDGRPMDQVKPSGEDWALVVGSEARGLSPFWRGRLDEAVTIPGPGSPGLAGDGTSRLGLRPEGKAESLNAAVAGAIILHYFLHPSDPAAD